LASEIALVTSQVKAKDKFMPSVSVQKKIINYVEIATVKAFTM